MKRRGIAAGIAFVVFSWLSTLGAYNAHQLFSGSFSFSLRLSSCAVAILHVSAMRHWFILLECSSVLAIFWMVFSTEYIKYRSNMIHICLDIYTPAADGQGQYGTAHWLSKQEKDKVFTAIQIDLQAKRLKELMNHGDSDLTA